MGLVDKILDIKSDIQTDKDLIELGFIEYTKWNNKTDSRLYYRLVKNGIIIRAFCETNNGSPYVQLGVVVNDDRGIVDRWRDCCSNGSVKTVVNNILLNKNVCSLSMNTIK